MSKAYKVFSRKLTIGKREGETVYSVRPVSYGTLTTEEAAKQISAESTATPADVKAVLDRYAYYVWWKTLPRVTTSSYWASELSISDLLPLSRLLMKRRLTPTW